MRHYDYAVQIQPRTGQELAEGPADLDPSDWTESDRARFPAADRQVGSGWKLILDRLSRCVYKVPAPARGEE